jgi:hypothetical protein
MLRVSSQFQQLKELTLPRMNDILDYPTKWCGNAPDPPPVDWATEYRNVATLVFDRIHTLTLIRFKNQNPRRGRPYRSGPYSYSVEATRDDQHNVTSFVWQPALPIGSPSCVHPY